MRIYHLIIALLVSCSLFANDKKIIFEKITEKIYKIYYNRGSYTTNMIASYGEDGLLLIDTGQEEEAEDLKKAILEKWNQLPEIIVNTHEHVDHTGGNAVFGKKPLIIGHELVRENLSSGFYVFDEFPGYSLPELNFKDSLSLFFNGEKIVLISLTGSHSQNDIIVWFTESNVMCIGDLAYKGYFPSYDDPRGVLKFSSIVQQIYQMVPGDIILIPGHYENLKKEDLLSFKNMLDNTINLVLTEFKNGKSTKDIIDANVLKDWESYGKGYFSTADWVDAIVQSQDFDGNKIGFNEELYKLYKAGKLNEIEDKYYELKKNHYDKYYWLDGILTGIAQKLLQRKKYEAAIVFLELEMKDYPESKYRYYNHYLLGKVYKELKDDKRALKEYKNALKLKPDSKTIKAKIAELE